MYNVQKHTNHINIASSQTFRFYLHCIKIGAGFALQQVPVGETAMSSPEACNHSVHLPEGAKELPGQD
jgi:hypothetical protein